MSPRQVTKPVGGIPVEMTRTPPPSASMCVCRYCILQWWTMVFQGGEAHVQHTSSLPRQINLANALICTLFLYTSECICIFLYDLSMLDRLTKLTSDLTTHSCCPFAPNQCQQWIFPVDFVELFSFSSQGILSNSVVIIHIVCHYVQVVGSYSSLRGQCELQQTVSAL